MKVVQIKAEITQDTASVTAIIIPVVIEESESHSLHYGEYEIGYRPSSS